MTTIDLSNEALDEFVMKHLRAAPAPFAAMWFDLDNKSEASMRPLDRALQRLKRKGAVVFDTRVRWWRLKRDM